MRNHRGKKIKMAVLEGKKCVSKDLNGPIS